uniref:Alginate lyase n=1 Tax=uncultured Thiotrichaceae bacterium TaxID=298394 RepID=A0A6S6SUX2_9GAMM|nr:MAG: Alginate lyase [uncultured Thiotrichaceae bacterium]
MGSSLNNCGDVAYLDEPKAGRLNIRYSPDVGTSVIENPPRFMWLPVVEDEAHYVLRVSSDKMFAEGSTQLFSNIPLNFFTPDVIFEPGQYYWSYAVWDTAAKAAATAWSQVREFTIEEDLIQVPLLSRKARYQQANTAHPRLWLDPKSLKSFSKSLSEDSNFCNWEHFFEKSVTPWLERPVMEEPKPYPSNVRVAPIWRQTYIDCQELLYAIRHLAVAGQVLKDQKMLDHAKAWLLGATEWDPEGPTSRAYTDEWAFRVALALAWG